jgi:histidine triad (HIT) family protein
MTDLDCFICRKHRGQTTTPGTPIFQDELLFAGHVDFPPGEDRVYLGYLMVEPRRHAPGLADLTVAEAQALGLLVTRLSRALKACEAAEHVYAFVLGDAVPHLHVHLVPRYPGASRAHWGVHVDEWPDAPRGNAAAVTSVCLRLRRYLEEVS